MNFVPHFFSLLLYLLDDRTTGEKYGEVISCQWLLGPGSLRVTVASALANRKMRPYQILTQSSPKQRSQEEK